PLLADRPVVYQLLDYSVYMTCGVSLTQALQLLLDVLPRRPRILGDEREDQGVGLLDLRHREHLRDRIERQFGVRQVHVATVRGQDARRGEVLLVLPP